MFRCVTLEQRGASGSPFARDPAPDGHGATELEGGVRSAVCGIGRPSIAPEYVLRALLLQAFYSVRSEGQLVEQLDYNLLFRWFVGLGMDDAVWNHAVFSKNRDRLLNSEVRSGSRRRSTGGPSAS